MIVSLALANSGPLEVPNDTERSRNRNHGSPIIFSILQVYFPNIQCSNTTHVQYAPNTNSTSMISGLLRKSHVSPQGKLELESVIDVWRVLFWTKSLTDFNNTFKLKTSIITLLIIKSTFGTFGSLKASQNKCFMNILLVDLSHLDLVLDLLPW